MSYGGTIDGQTFRIKNGIGVNGVHGSAETQKLVQQMVVQTYRTLILRYKASSQEQEFVMDIAARAIQQ